MSVWTEMAPWGSSCASIMACRHRVWSGIHFQRASATDTADEVLTTGQFISHCHWSPAKPWGTWRVNTPPTYFQRYTMTCMIWCDAVAILAGQQTCYSQVTGSSPGWAQLHSGLGQATYTCVPLSSSTIIWHWPGGGGLFCCESNREPGAGK